MLLALLLSGCLSGETPAGAGEPIAPAAANVSAPEAPLPNATEAAAAGWVPMSVPIAYEGKTGTALCVPAGPNTCLGGPVSIPSENAWYVLEAVGVPQSVSLNVTWTAATPATAELEVTLVAVRSCGEDCWEGERLADPLVGPSPLSVSLTGVDMGEYETLAIVVENAPLAPRPPMVYYFVSLEQAFKVEGEVVTLAPAA